MSTISIESGGIAKIIDKSDPNGDYDVDILDGPIALGRTKERAYDEARVLSTRRPATLTKHSNDRSIFAYAPSGGEVRVSKTHFTLFRLPPMTLSSSRQNAGSIEQQTYQTSGTSAEQLPSISVPDGFDVLIGYLNGNSGDVFVGDSDSQDQRLGSTSDALTFGVTNTDSLYIQTPTSGDGVVITAEQS